MRFWILWRFWFVVALSFVAFTVSKAKKASKVVSIDGVGQKIPISVNDLLDELGEYISELES